MVRDDGLVSGMLQFFKKVTLRKVRSLLPDGLDLIPISGADVALAKKRMAKLLKHNGDWRLGGFSPIGGQPKNPQVTLDTNLTNGAENATDKEVRILKLLKGGERRRDVFLKLYKQNDVAGLKALEVVYKWFEENRELLEEIMMQEKSEKWIADYARLFQFQAEIISIWDSLPDDHTVGFISNEPGGIGKSTLIANYEDAHPEDTLVLDGSDARECHSLASSLTVRRVVIFSLTREEGANVSMKAVENYKDARFNKSKFRNKRFKSINHPHVFIFSNAHAPNKEGLTLSRWRIGRINKSSERLQWFRYNEQGEEVPCPDGYFQKV